jgi:dienelactone hydrolase
MAGTAAVMRMLLVAGACICPVLAADDVTLQTMSVQLPAGTADVDVYWPGATTKAPLVIVAHGFSRGRQNMAGWGRHLAGEGIVTAVPDLPAWSDHARNGLFLSQLRAHLLADPAWQDRIDPARVGLLGFSAGALASLLSAADPPGLAVWVGLDPVDHDGLGGRAAAMLQLPAVVLTAEPSACNAQGNARDILAALPRREHIHVAGAVHVDGEWPTSWLAELVCGRSPEESRREFQRQATRALKDAFAAPAESH